MSFFFVIFFSGLLAASCPLGDGGEVHVLMCLLTCDCSVDTSGAKPTLRVICAWACTSL